jgi:hypothetical protein
LTDVWPKGVQAMQAICGIEWKPLQQSEQSLLTQLGPFAVHAMHDLEESE